MKRPTFTMLVGLPAVGKSTFIKDGGFSDAVIVSSDAFVEARAAALGATYNDVWADCIKEAEAEMWDAFGEAYRARRNIVVDRTNMTVKSRRRFLATMSPSAYYRVAVVFEVPEEVRLQRATQRAGKVIGAPIIERMREFYQPPTLAEGFDAVVAHYLPFEVAA